MAGRRAAGIGQLLLATAGFLMVLGWFALLAMQAYNELVNDVRPSKPVAWLGAAGGGVFAVAWLWSLVTSLSVLRQARHTEAEVPPTLDA
jgi:hypothetical protein